MMKLIGYVIVLIVIVLGVVLSVLNPTVVDFNYYFGVTHLSLAVLLALSFACGVLLAGVVCSLRLLAQRFTLDRLNRRLNRANCELDKLSRGLLSRRR